MNSRSSVGAARPTIVFCIIFVVALVSLGYEVNETTKSCYSMTHKGLASVGAGASGIVRVQSASSTWDNSDYVGPQTTYAVWKHEFPCSSSETKWNTVQVQRSPTDKGLLFTREMKTGSSTMAGVLLRIAHRKSPSEKRPCRLRIDHSSARDMEYINRQRKKSFLMSMLRDPTKRAISQYFHFKVSGGREDPTDANFINNLMVLGRPRWNYYLRDLSMNETVVGDYFDYGPTANESKKLPSNFQKRTSRLIEDILKRYDFIAITERMDESLVVLKLLLNLDYQDILYMSMKTHGSFTHGRGGRCVYLIPSFLTDGMEEFFNTTWKHETVMGGDMKLYRAAVKSLDNTIDALGRDIVEKQVTTFQKALRFAADQCEGRAFERCNSKGELVGAKNSTCYLWDIGCGYECLNELDLTSVVE